MKQRSDTLSGRCTSTSGESPQGPIKSTEAQSAYGPRLHPETANNPFLLAFESCDCRPGKISPCKELPASSDPISNASILLQPKAPFEVSHQGVGSVIVVQQHCARDSS